MGSLEKTRRRELSSKLELCMFDEELGFLLISLSAFYHFKSFNHFFLPLTAFAFLSSSTHTRSLGVLSTCCFFSFLYFQIYKQTQGKLWVRSIFLIMIRMPKKTIQDFVCIIYSRITNYFRSINWYWIEFYWGKCDRAQKEIESPGLMLSPHYLRVTC